jgi:hypothetical protein
VAQEYSVNSAVRPSVTKTTDIGEKLEPQHVVFGGDKLSKPAVIAVKGSVFWLAV